jgi:preprotein translocase subunit SecD
MMAPGGFSMRKILLIGLGIVGALVLLIFVVLPVMRWAPVWFGKQTRVTVAVDAPSYWRNSLRETAGALGRVLARAHVAYDGIGVGDDAVTVHAAPEASSLLAGFAATQFTRLSLRQPSPGVFVLSPGPQARRATDAWLDQQTAAVVQRRLELSQSYPVTVTPVGDHRLRIGLVGTPDLGALGLTLAPPGVFNIQVVDEDAARVFAPVAPIGDLLLPWVSGNQPPLPVRKRIAIPGADIVDAVPGFDRDGGPDVQLRLNDAGTQALAHLTSTLVNARMAVVLDGKILMAPVVNEPILGGAMIVVGHFTVAETRRLAILMGGGGLPAPVHVLSVDSPL